MQCTLKGTPNCSNLSGTASYETYVASQKESGCVDAKHWDYIERYNTLAFTFQIEYDNSTAIFHFIYIPTCPILGVYHDVLQCPV